IGLWLTPMPSTNRPGNAPASVLAAALVAQASRTKMLAMPVATTRRLVAERNIEALVKASLPRASPNHSAAYPNSSISATASRLRGRHGVEVRAPEADLSSKDRTVRV